MDGRRGCWTASGRARRGAGGGDVGAGALEALPHRLSGSTVPDVVTADDSRGGTDQVGDDAPASAALHLPQRSRRARWAPKRSGSQEKPVEKARDRACGSPMQ